MLVGTLLTWQRPGELLCVLSQDTVEWVDVEAVGDPPPILTSTDDTATIITNVGGWLYQGLDFSEVEEVDVT